MKIKFLKPVLSGRTTFQKGEVYDVPAPAATTYIGHGYAQAVETAAQPEKAKPTAAVNKG